MLKEEERYAAMVEVHEHPVIILEQDRLFNLSCVPGQPAGMQMQMPPG